MTSNLSFCNSLLIFSAILEFSFFFGFVLVMSSELNVEDLLFKNDPS